MIMTVALEEHTALDRGARLFAHRLTRLTATKKRGEASA